MKFGTIAELKNAVQASGHWDEEFCDEACLQRYLRARNGDVTKAAAMLKATLEWRKEQKVDDMKLEEFANMRYMREGWVYVDGNDADGRSVVMFRKRKDKLPLSESDQYLRFMTFVIETAVKNMKNGQEQWIWILDLAAYSPTNAPPLSITLSVLQLLANHYPERLYKAYVVNAPSIFQLAWKVLYPFVDHVTRSKAEFINTRDLHLQPSKASAASSWGSWASSMFTTHKNSSSSSKVPDTAAANGAANEHHADAQITLDGAGSAFMKKGCASSFAPFLKFYDTPYSYERNMELLKACGW
eukprot:GHRR01000670.1.p1 GENE.GHRR01000670.1~~GHRR01000670.1.p1  ORF type:complete len:300 (+),score=95.78 GHRR01000670.1:132-1031(+)